MINHLVWGKDFSTLTLKPRYDNTLYSVVPLSSYESILGILDIDDTITFEIGQKLVLMSEDKNEKLRIKFFDY